MPSFFLSFFLLCILYLQMKKADMGNQVIDVNINPSKPEANEGCAC